jgi:hypothetical protein
MERAATVGGMRFGVYIDGFNLYYGGVGLVGGLELPAGGGSISGS